MKPKMYSQKSNALLHDHIIDGFHTTHEGLHRLKEQGLVSEAEYTELLEKNVSRLLARIKEFRVAEKLTCIFFAFVFLFMQVKGEDLDMRRSARARTSRSTSRGGRRDLESA